MPRPLFDQGGVIVHCEVKEKTGVPGIDPESAEDWMADHPGDQGCLDPQHRWGRFRNHGTAPALDTRVTFVVESVEKANEEFDVDDEKRQNFPYDPEANSIPASPRNLQPGQKAQFFRIPTPVYADRTGQLDLMKGYVEITYGDLQGREYATRQTFRASVKRDEESGKREALTLTFLDEKAPPVLVADGQDGVQAPKARS